MGGHATIHGVSSSETLRSGSRKWNPIKETDGAAHVVVSNSLISYHWTSADDTDAPDATDFADYVVGAASDGAAAGLTYHVIDGAWVATGATVTNLYGGA